MNTPQNLDDLLDLNEILKLISEEIEDFKLSKSKVEQEEKTLNENKQKL